MLPILIVLSVVALAGAVWAASPEPHPVRWGRFVWLALPGIVLPMFIFMFPTLVLILVVCLVIALRVWPAVRGRVRSFWPLAGLSVVVAFGLACAIAIWNVSRFDRMRERYAYESIEDRLPVASRPAQSETAIARESDTHLEKILAEYRNPTREQMLRQLHEKRVREFVESPGFGVSRMFVPAEWGLKLGERPPVPNQPVPTSSPASGVAPSAKDEPDLELMHELGTVDFVNPFAFGYVKDRKHVAGFVPHAFSTVPDSTKHWQVERLDLIGLLLHAEPVAYVSEKLPAMDDLRGAPIRKLDAFEADGLEAVRGGQTLYLGPPGERPRMVGAIRSARQCVACHGGERGDLLGAFSYTLQPVTTEP